MVEITVCSVIPNFEALKILQVIEILLEEEIKKEANYPITSLGNRTYQSLIDVKLMVYLKKLEDLNCRH